MLAAHKREFQAPPAHLLKSTPNFIWPNDFSHVDLEIGAGTGEFAAQYAQENPQRFLITLERTTKISRLLGAWRGRSPLNNLYAARADAQNWIPGFVPSESLDRIFILYPNPYPKPSQAKRRWANLSFTGFLLSRLQPGGELILASNLPWYLNEAAEILCRRFPTLICQRHPVAAETPRTAFERKYLARGEPCDNLVFRKRDFTTESI